jgi:micrococcal nuclease
MKFEKLITVLLIPALTTGCQTTQQPLQVNQPQQSTTPTVEAPAPVVTTSIAQNALPQVVSVGDGDTLRARLQGKIITIRLGCIDAPETAQTPWGKQSANRLQQLLPAGQAIQVREIERDRYGRTVAEIYLGNQSVNLTMVKEGQAVVYPQYLSGCSETKEQYLQTEAQAKAQRLGFWNQANPVMPWDYRAGKRSLNQNSGKSSPRPTQTTNPTTTTTPSPVSTPTSATNCSPSYPDVCIPPAPPDLNCKDITYRNFRVLPPDPHRFDGNKDGVGCES